MVFNWGDGGFLKDKEATFRAYPKWWFAYSEELLQGYYKLTASLTVSFFLTLCFSLIQYVLKTIRRTTADQSSPREEGFIHYLCSKFRRVHTVKNVRS